MTWKFFFRLSLLGCLLAIVCGGCGDGRTPNPIQTLVYQGRVIDQDSREPISGLEVEMAYYLGGSAQVGTASSFTDANGRFSISYDLNMDTLMALSARHQVDTSMAYQSIYLLTLEYVTLRAEQNNVVVPTFRYKVDPSTAYIMEVVRAGNLHLEMVNTINPQLIDDISVRLTQLDVTRDGIDFILGNPYSLNPIRDIPVPAFKRIGLSWEVLEGTHPDSLVFARSGGDTIQIGFRETLSYEIQH